MPFLNHFRGNYIALIQALQGVMKKNKQYEAAQNLRRSTSLFVTRKIEVVHIDGNRKKNYSIFSDFLLLVKKEYKLRKIQISSQINPKLVQSILLFTNSFLHKQYR